MTRTEMKDKDKKQNKVENDNEQQNVAEEKEADKTCLDIDREGLSDLRTRRETRTSDRGSRNLQGIDSKIASGFRQLSQTQQFGCRGYEATGTIHSD